MPQIIIASSSLPHARPVLVNDLGLFARNLATSPGRGGLAHSSGVRQFLHQKDESISAQNPLRRAERRTLSTGLEYSESATSLATQAKDNVQIVGSLGYRATAHFALGNAPLLQRLPAATNYDVNLWRASPASRRPSASFFVATGSEH